MPDKKQNRRVLWGMIFVVILSIILRIYLGYMMRDSFFSRGNRYSAINPIALNIVTRGEFSVVPGIPTACNEPMYPFFIAFTYLLFGYNWMGPVIFQSLIAILNAIVIYHLSLAIFSNQRVSLMSFLLFLLYPFLFFQAISISDTVFFCFWLALSALLTLHAGERDSLPLNLLCGVSWGVALLTRMSALSLFPFALLFLLLYSYKRNCWLKVFTIFFVSLLTISPWLIRNYNKSGKILISSHGAIEIWLGFNSETTDILSSNRSVDLMKRNIEEKIQDIKTIRKNANDKSILAEYSEGKIYIAEALKYIRQDPLRAIKMMPLKFEKFWSWNYNPVPTTPNRKQDRLRRSAYTISYLPILILGIAGFVLAIKKLKKHALLFFLILGYTIMHAVLYGFTRLRIPIDQFLMIYFAYAINLILTKLKSDG